MTPLTRKIANNTAVLLLGLCAVEIISWATISVHEWQRDAKSAPQISSQESSVYSSPDVRADLNRHTNMPGSPYRYRSFTVYGYRPFTSRHVNIAQDGHRLNGATQTADNPAAYRVWMFGSSPVFGATNADNETIPAALERELTKRMGGHAVHVFNYGVVGYNSWQDFLNFSILLLNQPKPDVVVFMNGHNDYQQAWISESERCENLLDTAVGSTTVLNSAWEDQSHGKVLNTDPLVSFVGRLFSNTIKLMGLSTKFFELKASGANLDEWKRSYREKRDRRTSIAKTCIPRAQTAYLQNMSMAATLAKDNNISIAFIHQPLLYRTKKPLVGHERIEDEHSNYTAFAPDDSAIEAIREIAAYRISQAYHWDRNIYISSYDDQSNALRELSKKYGALFIDLEPSIVRANRIEVFSTPIHFTFRGTEIIAREIASALMP